MQNQKGSRSYLHLLPLSLFLWCRLLFLLLALSICACKKEIELPARKVKFNLILITLDTLNRDTLGIYSNSPDPTPNLSRFAKQAWVFEEAFCNAPLTLVSHASLFTAREPYHHGVRDNNQVLQKDVPLLTEHLKNYGYHTLAVISSAVLSSRTGIHRGFDLYEETLPADLQERHARDTCGITNSIVLNHAKEPFFLWIHFYDPHWPYLPPDQSAPLNDIQQAYLSEIKFLDSQLGPLLENLTSRFGSRSYIVVAADHGESLGKHGELTHGFFTYDQTMRIPLMIRSPEGTKISVSGLVSLVDLAPTLLSFMSLPPLQGSTGRDLSGEIPSGKLPDAFVYGEAMHTFYTFGWAGSLMLRSRYHKLIYLPQQEFYDLKQDPQETRNLFSEKKIPKEFEKKLQKILLEARTAKEPESEQTEQLRNLGYINPLLQKKKNLADPKIHLSHIQHAEEIINSNLMAVHLLSRKQFQSAELYGIRAKKLNPAHAETREILSRIYYARGKIDSALKEAKKAVDLNPRRAESRYNLGVCFLAVRQYDAAILQFQEAIRLNQKFVDAYLNLGAAYQAKGATREAMNQFELALSRGLSSPFLYTNLAKLYRNSGNIARAAELLETANQLYPNHPEVQLLLNLIRQEIAIQ